MITNTPGGSTPAVLHKGDDWAGVKHGKNKDEKPQFTEKKTEKPPRTPPQWG